jgi:hypothetical protein
MQADINRNNSLSAYADVNSNFRICGCVSFIHHINIDIYYLFHLLNSPKQRHFRFCIGLCLGVEENLKHAQNTKNRRKIFLKSFKICHNRDLKKAQKTKIGLKGSLPDMWIGDNNHNKHIDTVSNCIIPIRIPKKYQYGYLKVTTTFCGCGYGQ